LHSRYPNNRASENVKQFNSEFHIHHASAAFNLLTIGQLKNIFRQIERYLGQHPAAARASLIFSTNEGIDHQLNYERSRKRKPKPMDALDPRPSVIEQHLRAEQSLSTDMIRRAIVIAPLPNVDLVRLAALTVEFLPKSFGPADDGSRSLYNHRVGVIAAMYNKLFKEVGYATLPDIVKVMAGPRGRDLKNVVDYFEATFSDTEKSKNQVSEASARYQALYQAVLQYVRTIYLVHCKSRDGDRKALEMLLSPSAVTGSLNVRRVPAIKNSSSWLGHQEAEMQGLSISPIDTNAESLESFLLIDPLAESKDAAAIKLFAESITLKALTEASWIPCNTDSLEPVT
jgi:hypothetical protein